MHQLPFQPRRHRLQLNSDFGGDDTDFVRRGGDVPFFPGIKGYGDLRLADAGRLRGPNRAVQVAASAAFL